MGIILALIVAVLILGLIYCFSCVFLSWDYEEYGLGNPVKGYINERIKHSCINCKYKDDVFCRNPKVLELNARTTHACEYNQYLSVRDARKYSIFCYKRKK